MITVIKMKYMILIKTNNGKMINDIHKKKLKKKKVIKNLVIMNLFNEMFINLFIYQEYID